MLNSILHINTVCPHCCNNNTTQQSLQIFFVSNVESEYFKTFNCHDGSVGKSA